MTSSSFLGFTLGRMMDSGMAKRMNAPLTVTVPIAACEPASPNILSAVGIQSSSRNHAIQLSR